MKKYLILPVCFLMLMVNGKSNASAIPIDESDSIIQTRNTSTLIEEVTQRNLPHGQEETITLNIYQNPEDNSVDIEFRIQNNLSKVKLEMLTFKGKIVYQEEFDHPEILNIITIDISNMKNGVYFIRLNEDTTEPLVISR